MMTNDENAPAKNNQSLQCPVCHHPLSLGIARGRKSGKPFIMVLCLNDGRHFRGFIGYQEFVRRMIDRLEAESSERQEQNK